MAAQESGQTFSSVHQGTKAVTLVPCSSKLPIRTGFRRMPLIRLSDACPTSGQQVSRVHSARRWCTGQGIVHLK
jgi:hypothetical protein